MNKREFERAKRKLQSVADFYGINARSVAIRVLILLIPMHIDFHWATNWRYSWTPCFLVDDPIAALLYSTPFVAQNPC
jgi:hypothetical protein